MRLQLIIEAINRTGKAWQELHSDATAAVRDMAAVTAAGNQASAALERTATSGSLVARVTKTGPAVAAFRDYIAQAQASLPPLQAKIEALRGPLADITSNSASFGQALDGAGKKGSAALNQVHDSARRTHSMLGQMVQMAIFFASVMAARKGIETGYDYNKTLETSKLGIAAITTSMATVTDSQGRVLQGQEKFNASMQVSVEAQKELRKIAMETPATFQELVQTFQGIEAPALSAKMTFEEILEFTGLMANSVKAIGLPLQQVVQESRDLAAGTIDQNSQLARSLQITNEDVKKWREKGIVFQEIKKRLEGFVFASKEYSKTVDGALSNFKDIAQRALGEGSTPLFNFLRDELTRLTNDMVNVTKDASGKIVDIQVKPEVIARIRELAEGLTKLVQILERVVKLGVKFAEPIMWGAIALGIGKVSLAIMDMYKAIKTGEALTKGSVLVRLLARPDLAMAIAAIIGVAYTGKRVYDNVQLSNRADDISRIAGGTAGKNVNAEQFKGPQLKSVLEKFPDATDAEIVEMIKKGTIKLSAPDFSDRYTSPDYKIHINEDTSKALLGTLRTPTEYKVAGNNKKTPAQLKLEEDWRKIYSDLERDREKGQWNDPYESRKLDLKNKYEDLRHKEGADLKRLAAEEAKDLQAIEEEQWASWNKEIAEQEKKRLAAREKIRDALRSVDEQIADHALTELDRQLAGQDKFYFESLEKLQDAGMDFESVVAKEPEIYAAAQKKKLQILNNYLNQKRQAEISLELSKVDYGERDRSISKDTAAGERVRLTRELLDLQTARLEQLAQEGQTGSEAWNSQAAAIQATRARLFELTEQLRERTGTFGEGLTEGFKRFNDDARTYFQAGLDIAKATADGMQQAFSDGFFDVMQGKFNSLGQYVLNFLQAVQRAIANFMAQQMTNAVMSNAGSWIGSLFGAGGTGGGSTPTGANGVGGVYAHTGGLILHEGGLVPRFHFGGLAADEVPAVLLKKERVLSREQNVLFEKFVNKTEGPQGLSVAINIENQTGQPVEAKTGPMRLDGEAYVIGVVLKALNTSPSFRSAVRG
jgi:hypothetical protein